MNSLHDIYKGCTKYKLPDSIKKFSELVLRLSNASNFDKDVIFMLRNEIPKNGLQLIKEIYTSQVRLIFFYRKSAVVAVRVIRSKHDFSKVVREFKEKNTDVGHTVLTLKQYFKELPFNFYIIEKGALNRFVRIFKEILAGVIYNYNDMLKENLKKEKYYNNLNALSVFEVMKECIEICKNCNIEYMSIYNDLRIYQMEALNEVKINKKTNIKRLLLSLALFIFICAFLFVATIPKKDMVFLIIVQSINVINYLVSLTIYIYHKKICKKIRTLFEDIYDNLVFTKNNE